MGCRKGTKSRVQKELEAIATRRLARLQARLSRNGTPQIHPKYLPNTSQIRPKFVGLPLHRQCKKIEDGIHPVFWKEWQGIFYCKLCHKSVSKGNPNKRVVSEEWTLAGELERMREGYKEILTEIDSWPIPRYMTEPETETENSKTQSTLTTADPVGEGNSQS